jgi:transposase-like protein
MKCRKCGSEHVVKAGLKRLAEGKVQRYRCQECKHYFTGQEKYHRLSEEKKELIDRMYEEKGEQRKIARVLGVNLKTVQWHLKKR